MSKYGFNKKELRKIITTAIDKDGFHNQNVEYTDKYPFDIPVANVKFVNTRSNEQNVIVPVVDSERGMMAMYKTIPAEGSYTFNNVPISCVLRINSFPGSIGTDLRDFPISGNAEVDNMELNGRIIISGDCEISIPSQSEPV